MPYFLIAYLVDGFFTHGYPVLVSFIGAEPGFGLVGHAPRPVHWSQNIGYVHCDALRSDVHLKMK